MRLICLERVPQRATIGDHRVGKAGIVARKIRATFSSIGLMALYLNVDALHGDLGVVAPEDVVCCSPNKRRNRS